MEKEKNDKRITVMVEKTFTVPAERVFDAWIDTRTLSSWMFGPTVRDEEIISLMNDPRPAGTFSFVVRRGEDQINHLGTYLELSRPGKLVFTWGVDEESGPDSVVTVTIEPSGSGCKLKLVHDMDIQWSEYAERTKKAWEFMTEKLREVLM